MAQEALLLSCCTWGTAICLSQPHSPMLPQHALFLHCAQRRIISVPSSRPKQQNNQLHVPFHTRKLNMVMACYLSSLTRVLPANEREMLNDS